MIEVDRIPMDVRRAMRVAWARRNNSDSPEKMMADLAVAMLAAWPDAWPDRFDKVDCICLPLPTQEADA